MRRLLQSLDTLRDFCEQAVRNMLREHDLTIGLCWF
jgi:energy-converting hydrogenase A subunit M